MKNNVLDELVAIRNLLREQLTARKEIMSLGEACAYLSVSVSYLYKLTHTHQIPHYVPTGKKIFFKRAELDEWLLRNRRTPTAEIEQAASNYLLINQKRK